MSAGCSLAHESEADTATYRRILWTVLAVNGAMFVGETAAGWWGGSVALQADALDFLGDAATYALTLAVLGLGLRWRAAAAAIKGASMGLFGLWVLGVTVYHAVAGGLPSAPIMGGVGGLALAANVTCAALLYRHRAGDANRRSVWLCSRNDVLANIAVIAAGAGVWASASGWPDLVVGAAIAALALAASVQVLRQARAELATA
jgi:Co/Zn/Cd efflux system component